MKKIRIIGDLHLDDRYPGQLEAQIKALHKLSSKAYRVILLGDVFNKRNPSPKVLLAFQEFINSCVNKGNIFHILRGNHDSQTKADDGITALSLFESTEIYIYKHTEEYNGMYFIPHYEDEKKIISDLKKISKEAKNTICFGHFGFDGCLNSTGDPDFNIPLSAFTNKTYLGHIHNYNKPNDLVTVVGTPWSTSFSEAGKQCYVIDLIENPDNEFNPIIEEVVKVDFGPRFLTIELNKLKENKEYIEDPKYHTFLRVLLRNIPEDNKIFIGKEIENIVNVPYYELKFIPNIEVNEEISSFIPDKKLLEINDEIIKNYVNSNLTNLSYSSIMSGYALLTDENKVD